MIRVVDHGAILQWRPSPRLHPRSRRSRPCPSWRSARATTLPTCRRRSRPWCDELPGCTGSVPGVGCPTSRTTSSAMDVAVIAPLRRARCGSSAGPASSTPMPTRRTRSRRQPRLAKVTNRRRRVVASVPAKRRSTRRDAASRRRGASRHRVVIVGGGFGGLYAARSLGPTPGARSRSSTGATSTCSSRCSTRSRPARSRPANRPAAALVLRGSATRGAARRGGRARRRAAGEVDPGRRRPDRLRHADRRHRRPTPTSATTSGRPCAPGLKTIEDATRDPAPDPARVRGRRAGGRSGRGASG